MRRRCVVLGQVWERPIPFWTNAYRIPNDQQIQFFSCMPAIFHETSVPIHLSLGGGMSLACRILIVVAVCTTSFPAMAQSPRAHAAQKNASSAPAEKPRQ